MNLKLVVASMSILGLVSCPVIAATNTTSKKTHKVAKQNVEIPNYKEMGSVPVEPAPVFTCSISESSMVLDAMTHNSGRAIPSSCNPDWFNRISVSGAVTADFGKFGSTNAGLMGENYQRIALNDAYLNINAIINEWTQAFVSISFNSATTNDPLSALGGKGSIVSEYSAAYSNNITSGSSHNLQLDQAYATFSNFEVSPLFLQVGKQYQDFGYYVLHPITRSVTQVMAETLATSAKLGFIAGGFHGSIYAFDDPLPFVGGSSKPTNYGAALGFDMPSDQLGWSIGASYLNNMIGVNDVAYRVNQFNLAATASTGFSTRVNAASVYGHVNSGPFYVFASYVTALKRFALTDLPINGIADSTEGAKPWGAGMEAGYGFEYFCNRPQTIYIGYQITREAAGLALPKNRYIVGYDIEAWKATSFGIEWDHDNAYNVASGGTGRTTNLVSLRASAKFS